MYTIEKIKQRYSQQDVQSFIENFMKQENPRYDSFDYCYGYFQNNKQNLTKDMEKSCMALWSYLASWGMLRGSSVLLQKGNYKVLENTINVIQDCFDDKKELPKIKDDSRQDYVDKVDKLFTKIKNSIKLDKDKQYNPSNTLVTKIILGVFGEFPALDQYFCKTFGDGKIIKYYAGVVYDFFKVPLYHNVIQNISRNKKVKLFDGQTSQLEYPFPKLIDMFGFTLGSMVQGKKGKITINNCCERTIVIGEQRYNGKTNDIPMKPGKYRVEVLFQNDIPMVWDKVEVKK